MAQIVRITTTNICVLVFRTMGVIAHLIGMQCKVAAQKVEVTKTKM